MCCKQMVGLVLVWSLWLGWAGDAVAQKPVVAVFPIETKRVRLKADAKAALSEYLASRLVSSGAYLVVPKDQLKRALRGKKSESYKRCYAQSCQIEIGKELSASKSLATTITKIGGACVVAAALYDLRKAAAERGADAEGKCTELGLMGAIKVVVGKLTKGGRGSAIVDGPGPASSGPRVSGGTITQAVARLIVKVRPAAARVRVTGPGGFKSTGGSSWERANLRPGSYELLAGATGYVSTKRTVTLGADDLRTLTIELERPGTLVVTGEPRGARVEVTGPGGFSVVKGLPLTISGAAGGKYVVKVSRAGYAAVEREATVEAGRTATVRVMLTKAGPGVAIGGVRSSTACDTSNRAFKAHLKTDPPAAQAAKRDLIFAKRRLQASLDGRQKLLKQKWKQLAIDRPSLSAIEAKRRGAMAARELDALRTAFRRGDGYLEKRMKGHMCHLASLFYAKYGRRADATACRISACNLGISAACHVTARGKDGAPMVRVPAGTFLRGSKTGRAHEKPQRRIYLDAFDIDKHEVTVAQYRRCVQGGRCTAKAKYNHHCNWGKGGREQHPINCIDWSQARAYCVWAGKRLPTEAEWEKAARGTDGRQYPWGNAAVTCQRAVMKDGGSGCGRKSTWPVGSKSPAGDSPYGAQDMAGNVWEWTTDWYAKNYYGAPSRNPSGPSTGSQRVVRGGAYDSSNSLRADGRTSYPPAYRIPAVGFRCAMTR